MIDWHKNVKGDRPDGIRYCLVVEYLEEGEDGKRPYATVGRALYLPAGTVIPLALCEYENEQTRTVEGRLAALVKPDYWMAEGGFYEELDDGSMYHLKEDTVTHWAELPELPDCYGGDHNEHMQDLFEKWAKRKPSEVRVVKVK